MKKNYLLEKKKIDFIEKKVENVLKLLVMEEKKTLKIYAQILEKIMDMIT